LSRKRTHNYYSRRFACEVRKNRTDRVDPTEHHDIIPKLQSRFLPRYL
jgi:hypothetical protein